MGGARALPAISEARVLGAMVAWRRGVGALEPWFRATPFAAALHYRERGPRVGPRSSAPAPVERLLRSLPSPDSRALWIFDLPGPLALWLAYGLRRRFGMAGALAWNGWYDPRGVLDGSEERSASRQTSRRESAARSSKDRSSARSASTWRE